MKDQHRAARPEPAPSVVAGEPLERATGYAYYALFLLILTNAFNYVDRNIVSIIGQNIKQDLGLSDSDLGFLLGTAFAVLYSVAGIAMGRIADALSRTRLLASGLTVWSLMTALSGAALNFVSLAAARICVGIGEATANPCAQSLVCDYFPARNRSAALGAYLVSAYLGSAISLVTGAALLQSWPTLCTLLPEAACRLPAWRAAFLAVGLPGLVLAVLVLRLRTPPRIVAPGRSGGPVRVVLREISAAVPPFTLFNLHEAGGARAVLGNVGVGAGVVAAVTALSLLTGDWMQWCALGVGAYSVLSFRQVIRLRDRPLFDLTFGCPTFVLLMLGGAFNACFTGSIMTWSAPYALRTLHAPPSAVGLMLGGAAALGSGSSVLLGGLLADFWKRRDVRAPLWIGVISVLGPIPLLALLLSADNLPSFAAAYLAFSFVAMSWSGGFSATAQDLVLPRMRATTSSIFSLVMILISAGLGPYWAGKISVVTGSLRVGLISLVALAPIAVVLMLMAAKRLPRETAERRRSLAAAAGEPQPA